MRRTSCLMALCVAWPAATLAQIASGGALVQSYRMSDASARLESVTLLTAPFAARSPIHDWMGVAIAGAYADASMTLANGVTTGASGLVDSRVAIEARRRGFTGAISALLSTGDVVGSIEEATVVGMLSSEVLPFATRQWGAGGGFAVDVGYEARYGGNGLGLSVGYVSLRESTSFEGGSFAYRPATELRARALVEVAVGSAGILSGLVGLQSFGDDAYGATPLFAPGLRLEAQVSLAFPVGARESALLYGGLYRLGAGAPLPDPLGGQPVLQGVGEAAARQVLTAGGELRVRRGRLDLVPRGEARVVRRDDGLGQGWTASAGGRAEYRLTGGLRGRRLLLEPSAAVRVGGLTPQAGASSDVLGWEAGISLRWEGGR